MPCNSTFSITYKFNGNLSINLDKETYMSMNPVQGTNNCPVNFLPSDPKKYYDDPEWSISKASIKLYCIAYDYSSKRIGFARVKNP